MEKNSKTSKEHAEEFAARLNEAMKDNGYDRFGAGAVLAEWTGKTGKAANNWLNGEKKPFRPTIETIANRTGYRVSWLDNGELPKKTNQIREDQSVYGSDDARSNITYAPDQGLMRKYPLISNVQAGAWKEAIDLFQPGDAEFWETAGSQYSDQSFWLRVTGDSMTSPAGLSIPEGYLILVDPNGRADNGSLVVAKLEDSDEVTFKKLVIDAGQHYLKPLNPNYGTIHINGNCRIVGVVREVKLKI